MWAAQITEFNTPYTISTVNIPQLRPNELLVKYTPQILSFKYPSAAWRTRQPAALDPIPRAGSTVVQVREESASKWKDGDRVAYGRHGMPAELQPDHVINSTHDDACEKILERTGGEGLAAVINCTDSIAVNAWSL
ncbi:hypothetical protein APSETT444_007161 [Aspergillus pseudonomiae]